MVKNCFILLVVREERTVVEFFSGSHNLMLDQKNRMRLPAKFREILNGKFFILNGAGGCLMVLTAEAFKAMADKMAQIPFSAVEARRAVANLMANVVEPEEDAQGRFVLPSKAREYANINKNIVVIGACNYLEIWAEERYESLGIGVETDSTASLKALSDFGI